MMIRKLCSSGLDTARLSKEFLRRGGGEFVPDWLATNWILLAVVDDLDNAVVLGCSIQSLGG